MALVSFSHVAINPLYVPLATVYKGISTFDYIKMQRQRGNRSQNTEAGNQREASVGNRAPQVRPCFSHCVTRQYCHASETFFLNFSDLKESGELNRL